MIENIKRLNRYLAVVYECLPSIYVYHTVTKEYVMLSIKTSSFPATCSFSPMSHILAITTSYLSYSVLLIV